MNKDIKSKWLEALKSGKYTQTAGYLNRGDNHMCCLGVLCDISGEGAWVKDSLFHSVYRYTIDKDSEINYTMFLPPEIRSTLEFDAETLSQLMRLNDNSYDQGKLDYSEVIPVIENL